MNKKEMFHGSGIVVTVAAAAIVALASQSAAAQALPKRKPGLWEMTMSGMPDQTDEASRMKERLEKLPPDKRAQMEARLEQMGMSVPTVNKDGTITSRMRFCLTPEESAEEARTGGLDKFIRQDNCDTKETSRTATEFRYSSVCSANGKTRKMDLHVYGITAESWNMDTKMVSADGKEQSGHQSTRWISADCGPVGRPPAGSGDRTRK